MKKVLYATQVKLVNCFGFTIDSTERILNDTLIELLQKAPYTSIERIEFMNCMWVITYIQDIEVEVNDTKDNG